MEPITRVILYKNVPFRPDYSCVTDFENEAQRWEYLSLFQPRVLTSRLYVKYNDVNTLNLPFDEIHGIYNYMAYSNEQNENGVNINYKFAFITDIKWASQNSTFVRILPDVYQNEIFTFTLGASLIEREHQDRYDSYADPIFNYETDIFADPDIIDEISVINNTQSGIFYMIFVFTEIPNFSGRVWTDIPPRNAKGGDGFVYFIVPFYKDFSDTNSDSLASGYFDVIFTNVALYKVYITNNKIPTDKFDSCKLQYVVDQGVVYELNGYTFKNTVNVDYIKNNSITVTDDALISSTAEISPSTPVNVNINPKILTLPYSYLRLGTQDNFTKYSLAYALGTTNRISIYSRTAYSSDGVKTNIRVDDYLGDEEAIITSLNLTSCPELPLKNDVWENYLATHSAVLFPELISSVSNTLSLGYRKGETQFQAGTDIGKAPTSVLSSLANAANMKQTPDSVKVASNNGVGEIVGRTYGMRVTASIVHLNDQIREKICRFWYWYGYPCNQVKIPNLRSRYYFNYVKTKGAIINGVNDHAERTILEDIFNNGVTIYHCRMRYEQPFVCNYGECNYENTEVSLL